MQPGPWFPATKAECNQARKRRRCLSHGAADLRRGR